ncbi:hypothetical protein N7E70_013940 [Aminobacter sp. NyZ550]|uniref:hypothetical protein n=1 Tax=Aminobacter sp. NyZ550 TaxID=2979870 RepID=UPI0021D5A3E3|nr:hypothetical protein [Aminobacter sp. NyZ550]WAX92818.1 hypothetical protein N7E70_013940 [Aminobacter sp. NyZ550]
MITVTAKPQRRRRWRDFFRRRQTVLAVFSYRYDAHLVPDLLTNIDPIVDGWVALDDRASTGIVSSEFERQRTLIGAARAAGADWILAMDPDERFEIGAATAIRRLLYPRKPTAWGFNLRELYEPDAYRIDGIWGQKVRYRLFPAFDAAELPDRGMHACWYPRDGRYLERHCDLNLYHLKMIAPVRRTARRDLYNHLDPQLRDQPIGYDYLADETGARFETIPQGRAYAPPHHDDGGLWMAELAAAVQTEP